MRERLFALGLSVVLASLLLAACAKPAPAPASTTIPPTSTPSLATPKPTTAPAPAVKPTTLKFALMTTPSGKSLGIKWWAEEVEKRTGGRVKFEMYWSGALVPAAEILQGVRSGVGDLGENAVSYYISQLPLAQVTQLPGTSAHPFVTVKAWRDVYENVPEVANEYARFNQKALFFIPTIDYNVQTSKPFNSLAEMKGTKIRVFGTTHPKLLERAAGIVGVPMVAGEVYEALLRGTVVGCLSTHETADRYKWYEVAKYMIMWNMGTQSTTQATINLDVWNKLPADIQKIMLDTGVEEEKWVTDLLQRETADYINGMKQKVGYTLIELPKADKELINKLSMDLWGEIAAELEAKGLPGRKVTSAFRSYLDKWEQTVK